MRRTMMTAIMALPVLALWTSAATISSADCPDPVCCQPAPGPSSCRMQEEPCISTCYHTCPDGTSVRCASIGDWMYFCYAGIPTSADIPCYTTTSCTQFLNGYEPCMDPACTDPEAVQGLCDGHWPD